MTADAGDAGMVAVLEALTHVQNQLNTLTKSAVRVEARYQDILHRLDRIDGDQARWADLKPLLDGIVARSAEDREETRAGLETVAVVAAFAHAAVMGNRAPLPVNVADDPLLSASRSTSLRISPRRSERWSTGARRPAPPSRPSW